MRTEAAFPIGADCRRYACGPGSPATWMRSSRWRCARSRIAVIRPSRRSPTISRGIFSADRSWRGRATGATTRRSSCGAICCRLSVVAAAFLGLALIAGVTLWQNHRIEMARDATTQERDRAQQVSAFLVDVFSQADPYTAQGRETTAKELLDRGAAKIGSQNLQPEVRAQLLESIGVAYRRQGLSERAIPLFEQAVDIRRRREAARRQPHRRLARKSLERAHRCRPSGVRGGLSAASARDVAQGR